MTQPMTQSMEDLHGYYLEDLAVGMSDSYARTITDTDITLFAGISGDTNPVHLNPEFARQTVFKGTVAHGFLTASFLSAVIGTKLPGPGCIYLSQNLRFKAPVKAGDTVRARATITEIILKKKHVHLKTECLVDEKIVVEGEAVVMVLPKTKLANAS